MADVKPAWAESVVTHTPSWAENVVNTQSDLEAYQQQQEKQGSNQLLDAIGRTLDYGGGIARTGVAGAVDAVKGGNGVTKEDLIKALKGHAPSSNELMDKLGVPAGSSLSDIIPEAYSDSGQGLPLQKHGWADPTARGVAGLALDVGTDPLTYATLGASGLAKTGKAGELLAKGATVGARATEGAGESIYKSGLKRIDQEVAKYGKEPVSDLLMRENIAGSASSIHDQMSALGNNLLEKQKALLKAADESGSKVSMDAAMKDSLDKVAQIRASKDPKLQDVADSLEAEAKSYTSIDSPITPSQASGFKTSLYDMIPTGAFQESAAKAAGTNPALISGRKDQARGLKQAIEDALGPQGSELQQTNDELGRILTSKDKQRLEGFKEDNKNAITPIDAMVAAAHNPWMLAAKKAADIAKMTGPRTYTGRAMKNLGADEIIGPLIDIEGRRELINQSQNRSPWEDIKP